MKTSLNLEDSLFRAAQKEAQRTGRTLSETISDWARVGYRVLRREVRRKHDVPSVDLGGAPAIDINSRRDWLDALDT